MRRFEDNALAVALAVSFRLDAILANRSLLAALDATFTTRQASRLGSFT